MIALLIALTAAAADPTPALIGATVTVDRSLGFSNGNKARILRRAPGGASLTIQSMQRTAPGTFRGFTCTTSGQPVTATLAAFTSLLVEPVGATGWVDVTVGRGATAWSLRVGAGETAILEPAVRMTGPAAATFTARQNNTGLNVWLRD